MKSIVCIAFVLAVFLVPSFASAQLQPGMYTQQTSQFYSGGIFSTTGFGGFGSCTGGNIACIANTVLVIINNILVPVLFAIAFIVFLYGIAKAYIFSLGSDDVSKGHKLMLWGVIGFVVMISIWGLVNVVANTFGLGGAFAPPTPTSISPYQTGGGYGTIYIEKDPPAAPGSSQTRPPASDTQSVTGCVGLECGY